MLFHMPKIHYFLRSDNNRNQSHSLYCRITYKGSKTEFSLREKIPPKSWDQNAQRMRGNSPKSFYIKTLLEHTAYNLKTHCLLNDFSTAKELLQSFQSGSSPEPQLVDIVPQYIEAVRKKIKPGTLRNHEIKLQNLIDYQTERKIKFYPQNFTLPEAERFKEWFMQRAETDNVTTASRNISFFKKCLEHSLKLGEIKEFPLINYKGERDPQKDNIFLTMQELKDLATFCPQNIQLSRIKDLFLFQCYTGLSYGDLWSSWEIQQHEDQYLLIGQRSKNGQRFYVPLSSESLAILQRYPDGLPKYHNVVVNRILKELAALVGINKRITSHTGRKTFATIQDSLGWSRESLAKMLGHKSIKTTEQYYIGESEQRIIEELRKVG